MQIDVTLLDDMAAKTHPACMSLPADFSYNTTRARVAGRLLPGHVHQGFSAVAASLWPGLKAALDSLVKSRSSGTSIKHVYVAGHSLGAGVATLASYSVQVRHSHTSVRLCVYIHHPGYTSSRSSIAHTASHSFQDWN
jgi:predicted lipase